MNEFDPTRREHINLAPIERFKADSAEVHSYVDLYFIVIRYLTDEFNIPDYYVDRMFSSDGMLPTPELFDQDSVRAIEQAWLIMPKLALPIAEDMIENDDSFTEWMQNTFDMFIAAHGSSHDVEACMKNSHGNASHSCAVTVECPLKVTAYALIVDAAHADTSSMDYHDDWVDRKMARTLSKVEVARDLGLIGIETAKIITQRYTGRCLLRSKEPNI